MKKPIILHRCHVQYMTHDNKKESMTVLAQDENHLHKLLPAIPQIYQLTETHFPYDEDFGSEMDEITGFANKFSEN